MDIFATAVLRKVVASLVTPATHLLDRFFPMVQEETAEEIKFDIEERKLRITPYVSPLLPGRVVAQQGQRVATFKPAYVKDKRRFDPDRPLRRALGEAIGGGQLSPQQREMMALRLELEDQIRMLTVREEVQASEALRTGKITVAGDGYPTTVVDFGRHADLTIALLTTARWGESGVEPIDDIEDWAGLVQQHSGSVLTDVTMDPLAAKLFKASTKVQTLLDTRRGSDSRAELGPGAAKARFIGAMGDFNFWQYQEHYVDEDGAAQKVMPDYTVIGSGPELEGTRAYGAIKDPKAAYAAQRFFAKSWLEEDPAVRWLLLQSAPLMVPYRPNASFAATVHDGA